MYQKRSHAIVIGGSIAGLCAARALGDHFDRVTLIERDPLPDGAIHRRGVPQAHHLHVLLLRGLLELERLFPGLEDELTRAGAARVDLGRDVAHYTEWGWAPRAPIDVAPLTLSRLLLESVLRARTFRELRNLRRLEGANVTGLCIEHVGRGATVTGVETSDEANPRLMADLVVDASGRNTRCPHWLEQHRVRAPEEQHVDPFAGYASRFYELAPDSRRWWRGLVIDARLPSLRRWALLMPIEHGRVGLTVGGINRDYPPGDEAGFHEFLSGLASPVVAKTIARAKPVTAIHTHRALSNHARHYETWKSDVAGFIAVGDSAVAFNAAYGQGMSMAALAVNTLDDLLASGDRQDPFLFTRRFHEAQWRKLRTAWSLATGADLRWPETKGTRPFGYAATTAVGNAIVRLASHDAELRRRLGPALQLLVDPSSLLRSPSFLARLALAALRRRTRGPLQLRAPSELDGSLVFE